MKQLIGGGGGGVGEPGPAGSVSAAGSGTAAAPGIAFASDPSTGIYNPGAYQLAISTNGVGRLFVDASGRVGLGTSAPAAQFVVGSGNTLLGHNTLDNYGGRVDVRSAYSVRTANVPTQLFVADSAGSQLIDTGGAIDLGGYQDTFSRAYSYARIQGLATASSGAGGYLSFVVLNTGGALIERVRINSAGNVGINTTSPAFALDCRGTIYSSVASGTANYILGDSTNGTQSSIRTSNNNLIFSNDASTERLYIDSSGRLLVGTSSARNVAYGSASLIQTEITNSFAFSAVQNSNNADGCAISLGKSRGTAIGGTTVLNNNDDIGIIAFAGADGTDVETQAATIRCEVDGTPGANNMPGRLVFSTTADGAASPTERMRIDSSGRVGIGTSGPSTLLHVIKTNSGADSETVLIQNRADASGTTASIYFSTNTAGTGFERSAAIKAICPASSSNANDLAFYTNITGNTPVERLRIDSAGNVGIGTTAPGAILHTVNRSAGAATVGAFIQNSSLTAGTEVRLGFAPNTNVVADNRYSWIGAINSTGSTDSSLTFATTPGGTGATERMRIKSNGIINFSNAPTYADNTAATIGGLAVGDVYKTVLGVLMIRF